MVPGRRLSIQEIVVNIRRPGHPERRVTLGQGVVNLGRADDNDVVLTDIGVSRRHARVLVQPGGVFVEDLSSGNGTYFRGMRIQRQAIQSGDEILIDPFTLSFEVQEGEATSTEGLTHELEDVGDEDTVEVSADPTRLPEPRASAAKRRARLTTLQGQRLAASYPVRPTGLTIGRSEARDVILFDPAASRNHAQLEWVGVDMWLRDHGSGNGTFVNGSRVREQCLRHGDRVRVGSTEFRFEWVDGPVHEPPTLPASHAQQRRQSEAQPDRTLRMSAPHQDDTWTMPPTDQGARLVATAAIGGFAVAAVMIVGGLLALYVVDFDWRGSAQAQQVAPFEVPQEAKATLAKHLKRGHSHFENGSYLKAASQFYAAQKLVDGHPESERMAVRSTEALLLDTLREGLVLRGLSETEQRLRRKVALRLGNRALAGRADRGEAKDALQDVLVFAPDDARVREMIAKLST